MFMKRKSHTGMPAGVVMGLLTGMLVTFALTMVVAALIAEQKISHQQLPLGAVAILLLSSYIGALVAVNVASEKRLLVGLASGGVYLLALMCWTALFFDGAYRNVWISVLVVMGSSIAASLTGAHRKTKGYGTKKYRARKL